MSQFCGSHAWAISRSESPSRGSRRSVSPRRARSNPCSRMENPYRAQNAVRTAMAAMQPTMAGEVKMSEALLLFR